MAAQARLLEERKLFRKDHPPGFQAKPQARSDGSADFLTWDCKVPGRSGTKWEGGVFPVTLKFNTSYPSSPPLCFLPAGFFHPNVYPTGQICLSIINDYQDWKPSITIKQILVGIQELLDTPNLLSPAQGHAAQVLRDTPDVYHSRCRELAINYRE